ncbi:MAG: element excision factor XisH family protein [Chloroflexota bacterium]
MPRYDIYHEPVKQALIKDGWVVTDDPFLIEYKGMKLYADLGAEKPIAAEKEDRQIVVEVKVFGSASPVSELQKAVGQYGIYRMFLERVNPERELFLAIAQDIYQDFFVEPAVQDIVSEYKIHLIVFDPDIQEIVEWIR